ncbi:hypothetical protein MRB53_002516 [Persea americana]|uniref:Uncharacterized protein n=1 Tax=Persea americana TaxID=3435 RepID=A0ACC2MV34_PERAE|nr:hypothetical protein MRB53_002516 [Persea americana]
MQKNHLLRTRWRCRVSDSDLAVGHQLDLHRMTADLGSFLYIIKNRERRSRQTADHKRAATICPTAYQICTPLLPFPAAAFYRHVCWLETNTPGTAPLPPPSWADCGSASVTTCCGKEPFASCDRFDIGL